MGDNNTAISQSTKEPHLNGLSVLVDPDEPVLDIVFVHGFTGHPERTWTHRAEASKDDGERSKKFIKLASSSSHNKKSGVSNVYWPRDLLPLTVPNARICTYGYDTRIRHRLNSTVHQGTVYDIAWDFLVSLEAARVESSRPLLFIAHSLGGIIVKEALRRSRGCELYQNQSHLSSVYLHTSGVFFFGTPHGGADPRGLIHHIAEKCIKAAGFSVSQQIINSLLPSAERLKELRDEFGPMARQREWVIYSFQEQHGVMALGNDKVVEDASSCLGDHSIEVTQRIARNHMDMCRFSGMEDVEYEKVVSALRRVVQITSRLRPDLPIAKPVFSAEQKRTYLDSLKFDEIDARHATIRNAHVKTCRWILSNTEYNDWMNANKLLDHNGFFWIKGKPATGKSTIMKFIFSEAKKKIKSDNTIVISFFFNARGEDLEKSVSGMYRSLLVQLLEKVPEVQDVFHILEFANSLSNCDTYTRGWDIETLKDLFGNAIERLQQRGLHLTCFIDALDECEEDQAREMVAYFEHLGQLAVSRSHHDKSRSRLYICFSSRHYPYITLEKGIQLVLEDQGGHKQDMISYVYSELKVGRSKRAEQLKNDILQKASGIFLWVVLVVQILNKEFAHGHIHRLQQRLKEIPGDLDNLFYDILTRDGQNMEELILCLQWVLYSRRPLRREELYFAILAGRGVVPADALSEWDSDDGETSTDAIDRFILSSSKGLAELTKSRKSPSVQFIHESVPDYLRKENRFNMLRPELGSNFPGLSHARLRECCQTYMAAAMSRLFPPGSVLPTTSSEDRAIGSPGSHDPGSDDPTNEGPANFCPPEPERFPFLEYAVKNILYHSDKAESFGISQDTFTRDFSVKDWVKLSNLFQKFRIRRYKDEASLLYILAELDLPNLIKVERKRLPHIWIPGERYGYPLNCAIAHANEDAIRALLLPTGDALCPGSPIYQEAIGIILENSREITGSKDRNILSWAAANGHEAIFKLILPTEGVDLNDNGRGRTGTTPLCRAAANGHEAIVKFLLATEGVDPSSEMKSNVTPLFLAAANGHKEIVELLLAAEEVDPNDNGGVLNCTPLAEAAMNGHEAIVKLLLAAEGIDPNSGAPLYWAAANGHEEIVKLLLAVEGIDLNRGSYTDVTPLEQATASGHDAIIKLLVAAIENT